MILSLHKLANSPKIFRDAAEIIDKFLNQPKAGNGWHDMGYDLFIHEVSENEIRVCAWNIETQKAETKTWKDLSAINALMPKGLIVSMAHPHIVSIKEIEEMETE